MSRTLILLTVLCSTLATPLLNLQRQAQTPLTHHEASDYDRPKNDTQREPVNEDMIALLNRFAPVFKLSKEEQYFPSSIEYMLDRYSSTEDLDGIHPANRSTLTPSHLDSLPFPASKSWLNVAEPHNPQPFLLDEESEYLYGPAGQPGALRLGRDESEHGRGQVREDVYGFWVDQGRGVVDLWYWTFYPFNFGKPVGSFGWLGHHIGDWEHLRMRTVNGSAVSVDFHTHNGGGFSAGTVRWDDVAKIDDRPVAYVAAGSHGVWPTPGDHIYAHLLKFRLIDVTDDHGPIWDTNGTVVASSYWNGPDRRAKLFHHGERSWLNYKGHWGNRGENDCWWHTLVGICQLVDAPPGPNRFFGTPPDCVPAPLSWEQSSYSFRMAEPIARWARARGVSLVQVEQLCARPRQRDDDNDDGDDAEEEDVETMIISGRGEFKGRDQHTITTLPCTGVMNAIKGYRISLCLPDGKCIASSGQRRVCTYEEGKRGYRFGAAAHVDDLDEWRWTP